MKRMIHIVGGFSIANMLILFPFIGLIDAALSFCRPDYFKLSIACDDGYKALGFYLTTFSYYSLKILIACAVIIPLMITTGKIQTALYIFLWALVIVGIYLCSGKAAYDVTRSIRKSWSWSYFKRFSDRHDYTRKKYK